MLENFTDLISISGFLAASLIAVVGKSFTDYVKEPLKYKGYDTWWASYVALAFGIIMVFLSGANMFAGEYLDGPAGVFITGLYAGGVSIGIYDYTAGRKAKRAQTPIDAEDVIE